ncbi:helix-turn-helix transcriptional regulator [Pseudooceanicola nanhaiensis]|uniref:helix-turn-helix transcriptional regulator n=1 Tax=Pseudooceanicola nanhaiensis TaxID=375761 RepID=UPI003518E017
MDAFASTGLVSLILAVMREADPALVAGLSRPDPMRGAVLPESVKRDLVDAIMARHGPGPLLSIGAHLGRADEMPVAAVLLRSAGPEVLAKKWSRLERYHHASHRTRIALRDGWECTRYSTGAPASVGENCLIAGLLLGLLRGIGCRECALVIAGRAVAAGDLPQAALPAGETLERFGLRWSGIGTGDAPSAPGARDVADRLSDLLAADPGRGWRIAAAARALGLSPRSLQRQLGQAERTFSGVLRRARMREATRLLTGSSASLAEIGYCCGYADQAHFQRDFLRATNTTPGAFRRIAG